MEDMQTYETPLVCPHCKKPGYGNLCSECGENLHPQRITLANILKEIPDIFLDVEYGLLYTIRSLLTRPGTELREYFAGDRQKHYKPLKFILFICGLISFLYIKFDISSDIAMPESEQLILQANSVLLMSCFPILSFITFLFFRRRRFTYGEHLIANAFLIAEVSIYNLVLFPLYYFYNHTYVVTFLDAINIFWIVTYYTYALYNWFYPKKTSTGFFTSLGVVLILLTVFIIFTAIASEIIYYVNDQPAKP